MDCIVSAYYFEQQGGDGFGPVLERNTTLKGYIEVGLSLRNHHQYCNFQVTRLSQMFKGEGSDITALALRALESLPFVGIVEKFDQSIEQMTKWLSSYFPGFYTMPVAKNVSRNPSNPLNEQIRDRWRVLCQIDGGKLRGYCRVQCLFTKKQ
ncbi:hypothetical protein [Nitrosomonas communis]|uniref:hypothetical protein n=1 Tax=Nitrosomonas communis TaxID=44574 RepID=UPI003D2CBDB9